MRITVIAAAMAAGGCQIDDLTASDFRKFARCVETTSKDGLVQKGVAKQVCAAKYSKLKKAEINGSGQFPFCGDSPCDGFQMRGINASRKTIVTTIAVSVVAGGKARQGSREQLWIEPGASFETWVRVDQPVTLQEREAVTWQVREVWGIDIED
jgi:hypothetical protein